MTSNDKIKQLRKARGLTQKQLAEMVGYTDRSMIAKIEAGKVDLQESKLKALFKALGVSPASYLDVQPSNLEPVPKMNTVPLIGEIACGVPITAQQNFEDTVSVPENIHADYALRCKGDSMINARIFNGDIVYIRSQPVIESGQIAAVVIDGEATLKRVRIYDDRIILEPENPVYKPLVFYGPEMEDVHIIGKATDALAFMNSRNAKIDPITGEGTLNKFGVELAILKLRSLQATLSPNTDKLLSTALATFTKRNDFRHLNGKEPNRRVSIPLKDYARLLGYEVDERETSTPQEAEREKKRAKNQLDNARKAVRKDLDIIHASTLTWEEPIRGKGRDFGRVSIVTYTGIKNGEIQIHFSPEIASYLAERNLITQYPTKLLSLDSRKTTAYYVGRKLNEHYYIDNNQVRGTADRISIPALLAVTDLASYEEVQKKDRGHWQERIKEPLERALDELTAAQILKDWKYTHARGVDLTDEEAENITSYSDYSKLYLHFTLAGAADQAGRIKAKQAAAGKKKYKKKR